MGVYDPPSSHDDYYDNDTRCPKCKGDPCDDCCRECGAGPNEACEPECGFSGRESENG